MYGHLRVGSSWQQRSKHVVAFVGLIFLVLNFGFDVFHYNFRWIDIQCNVLPLDVHPVISNVDFGRTLLASDRAW